MLNVPLYVRYNGYWVAKDACFRSVYSLVPAITKVTKVTKSVPLDSTPADQIPDPIPGPTRSRTHSPRSSQVTTGNATGPGSSLSVKAQHFGRVAWCRAEGGGG